jgi:hypothetical protein
MPIKKISDEMYQKEVLENSKPVCLKFEADWCG